MGISLPKLSRNQSKNPFSKSKFIIISLAAIVLALPLTLGFIHEPFQLLTRAQVAPPTFSFTAAGDHGSATNANTLSSMTTVGQSGSSFYLALGDLSYQGGGEQAWCNAFKSRFNDVELIAGNHDVGESGGGNINTYRTHCPFTLGNLTGDYGKQYYFDYPQTGTPLARFIMIAPGVGGSLNINYNSGGAGYVFTQNAIDEARANGIKWIVVGMHKNCISTGQKPCEIGTAIMNLMISKKVDLILQGHDHNYQRSHQLGCVTPNAFNVTCITDNGNDGIYTKNNGPVIVINGEFGHSLYAVSSSDSEAGYFAKIDGTTFGLTKYTVSNSQLTASYMRSGGGSLADTFVINDTSAPTPTTDPNAPTPIPTPVSTTTILNPIADATVKSDSAGSNFGSATILESDGSPQYVSYMKYDLAPLAGKTLVSAKLRMRVTDSSTSTQNVKSVANTTWTETGLTYNNRPAVGSVIRTFPGGSSGNFVEVDVTPGLAGKLGQTIAMAVDSTGTDGFDFYSRNNSVDKVSLIIVTQSSSVPTTANPTSTAVPLPTATSMPTVVPSPTTIPTAVPTSPTATTVTNYPIADSYVGNDATGTNYGTSVRLEADGSPSKIIYMKYDLSSLAGKRLVSAKLRMKVLDATPGIQNIKPVANTSWTETGLTYNNRPAAGATFKTFTVGAVGTFVEVDVTQGLSTSLGKVIAMAIDSSNSDGFDLASRENSVSNDRVRLLLTVQ